MSKKIEQYETVKRWMNGIQVDHAGSHHTTSYYLRWLKKFVDWIYGRESEKERVRPSELLHADRWKPKGLRRTGLTLITAGVSMMLIYVLGL